VHSLEEAKQAIAMSATTGFIAMSTNGVSPRLLSGLMMRDLFELGFIQLKELAFHPSGQ